MFSCMTKVIVETNDLKRWLPVFCVSSKYGITIGLEINFDI